MITPKRFLGLSGPLPAGRMALYRLQQVTVTEEPASVVGTPGAAGNESLRVAGAQDRAALRLRGQRDTLRPLGLAVIAVVVVGTFSGNPQPAWQGSGLGVTLALIVFAASLAAAISSWFNERSIGLQAAVISAMGAAGVALAALQPRGAAGLAVAAAVWMAIARLPLAVAIMLSSAMTVALGVASGLAGSSSSAILASTLLCALIGLIAYFLKQARESQDQTEMLLAQLEDAREEQTRAAAIAERGRIASELHDVLAHSLSGAAIQLQGARRLAEREQTSTKVREAIDRAGELVKEGLADARQAVGALRGERLPGVNELGALIDSFSADMALEVTLSRRGQRPHAARRRGPRPLPRCTGGADQCRSLRARRQHHRRSELRARSHHAERRGPRAVTALPAGVGLADVGGGRGLAGMRERLERAGGSMQAGPTDAGWRVELQVPA